MAVKIAINGFGRIGRNILRALYENNRTQELEIKAINDTADPSILAHLTQYDSAHGKFSEHVSYDNQHLFINNDKILKTQELSPEKLPWKALDIDVVLECTGHFASFKDAQKHLEAGAKKVLISAPAGDIPTIVYGVNQNTLTNEDRIVSNASCTTNCLVPLVKPLQDVLGIVNGLMTTIHAYTNDQNLVDASHKDLRRARSATHSLIPTKTGAASAIGLVLPELKGKLDGLAIRVPVLNVSLVDLTFTAKRETSVKEVNDILKEASNHHLKGILAVSELPLVSSDFNHSLASSIVDALETKVVGSLVKVLAWYDNEWAFSNRMLDTALYMATLNHPE